MNTELEDNIKSALSSNPALRDKILALIPAKKCVVTEDTEKIELNMFNRNFVERARAVGFTDDQINFLSEEFEFKTEEYD